MSREEQRRKIKEQREMLINELEIIYERAFTRLASMGMKEVSVAKLTQLILNSKEGAISPLLNKIEMPLITRPANQK